MKRLVIFTFAIFAGITPVQAGDSTHPFKTSKGKMVEIPWWETMASCYGRFHALSQYAAQTNADAAKKIGDYSLIALNLAVKRLTVERGISVDEAQKIVTPNAQQALQITTQGFTIYKMTGEVDAKNNEIMNECFEDFNAYAKVFPGELKQ